jgi:hypothetical protein
LRQELPATSQSRNLGIPNGIPRGSVPSQGTPGWIRGRGFLRGGVGRLRGTTGGQGSGRVGVRSEGTAGGGLRGEAGTRKLRAGSGLPGLGRLGGVTEPGAAGEVGAALSGGCKGRAAGGSVPRGFRRTAVLSRRTRGLLDSRFPSREIRVGGRWGRKPSCPATWGRGMKELRRDGEAT